MDVVDRAKKMLSEGGIAISKPLEDRILNDQLTHEDINLLKRNFNMLDWATETYKK